VILDSAQLHDLLKQHFGYESFRPLQEAIIGEVLAGKNTHWPLPLAGASRFVPGRRCRCRLSCRGVARLGRPGLPDGRDAFSFVQKMEQPEEVVLGDVHE
jgi:hypothetical protein